MQQQPRRWPGFDKCVETKLRWDVYIRPWPPGWSFLRRIYTSRGSERVKCLVLPTRKNHPEKSSYTRYRQTLFFTMEQRQKRPPEQVQQTFEHTGAACGFCLVTITGNRTCASSGWKSQTEVKTKRQDHLRHANKPKKKKE